MRDIVYNKKIILKINFKTGSKAKEKPCLETKQNKKTKNQEI